MAEKYAFRPNGTLTGMALAVILDTARSWTRIRDERRWDRDPADEQSPAVVLPSLRRDLAEARILAHRLRMDRVAAMVRPDSEFGFRSAGLLLSAARLSPVLHRIHQQLLSLFPAVPESVVEQVRFLENEVKGMLDGETRHPVGRSGAILGNLDSLLDDIGDLVVTY